MTDNDRRLIEDYIPIEQISEAAKDEKAAPRHGHISTLHLWWARRPLSAARAAVYGVMMPAPRDEAERKERSQFMADLCRWDATPAIIKQAREQVLAAHKARTGSDEPPRILDMFAGGGAIPLEAQRLGAQAYAVDLNPVAHIIELCTLVYPQRYGLELATLVRKWGDWVIGRVRDEIGDLYPMVDNPHHHRETEFGYSGKAKGRNLTPTAYLWTHTVPCKNSTCGGTIPLARQYWLARKPNRYVALRPKPDLSTKRVRFEVVRADREDALGFNPTAGSEGGNVTCPFCGTSTDVEYVKVQGKRGSMGEQLMAVICVGQGRGKVYLSADEALGNNPDAAVIQRRIEALAKVGITVPDEPLPPYGTLGFRVQQYGVTNWNKLFTPRQLLSLLTFVKYVKSAHTAMRADGLESELAKAVTTYLGILVNRLSDYNSMLCSWLNTGETVAHTFARQALPMIWDFTEVNPAGIGSGSADGAIEWIADVIEHCSAVKTSGNVELGTAMHLPYVNGSVDAVVTDPPYYDSVPYADLSDYFYVWMRRSIGDLHPEVFQEQLTPKTEEAISEPARHNGDKNLARSGYEAMMSKAFDEACRVLKPDAPMIVVYAHKTTAGWATLIDALRQANFVITEAWPLDTERAARLRAQDSAALASSIFIVARRREGDSVGDSEAVRPQLQQIVRERVATLLKEKVTGADLVIAAVGAGLRAYTQYARIEQPNGADFPTGDYLEFVQREVLRVVLDKVFEEVPDATPGAIQQIDQATRFYVLARYQYIASSIPFDEINTLLHAVSNRLEIADLAQGRQPLLKSGKLVQLYDYRQRGSDPELGLDGNAERIDILHRLLWLNDNEPGNIAAYTKQIGDEQLASVQLVAEALQGKTLEANSRTPEQHAAGKLLSGWKQIVRERGSYDPTARHLDYEADPDQPYTTDMFGGRPKRK